MAQKPKPNDEKRHHLFRTPAQFGQKLHANAFVESPDPYYTRIANKTHQILAQKYRSGALKMPSVKRGKVSKVSLLIIVLVASFASSIVYAKWNGQFQAQTSVHVPLSVPNTSFQISEITANSTGSIIKDNAFVANTQGRSITYTFHVWAETQVNGSKTQDMSQLFLQFSIAINDYTKNVTIASLLLPAQEVSFIYNCASDQPFRLIINYQAKAVQIGGTSTPLTIFFTYAYSE